MTWSELGHWWLEEVENDEAYTTVVMPLALRILRPEPALLYADIGGGEGRVGRALAELGANSVCVDINPDLATLATRGIVGDMASLPLRDRTVDGCLIVLALEHVAALRPVMAECARVTKREGVLAVVLNHPVWTAPGSTPITDTDGEVLWRPGEYFSDGYSEVPAGDGQVVFHHRSTSELLNAAADHAWALETMVELPHHDLADQGGIPRLLACRWRLLP